MIATLNGAASQSSHRTKEELLSTITTWTTLLVQTTSNLILFPLSALLMVGLVSAVVFLAKSIQSRYPRRPPHGYYE